MSKCFSFVVLFATFFAVTAEEFDPRDYMRGGYNTIEYRRILPDKPMLASYAAMLFQHSSTFEQSVYSLSPIAPFISDMTSYQIQEIQVSNDKAWTFMHDSYILYYSNDGLAKQQYDSIEKLIMQAPSLNPREVIDEDGVRLLQNDKITIAYLSDNFMFEPQSYHKSQLKNKKITQTYNYIDLRYTPNPDVPLFDFTQKNQKLKDSLSSFDFDSNTIYFYLTTPKLYTMSSYFFTNLPAATLKKEESEIKKYVQYVATTASIDNKTNKFHINFSVLCDTPENAKNFYDTLIKEKESMTQNIHIGAQKFIFEFNLEISQRKVSLKTQIDYDKFIESARQAYEKRQCSYRIATLSTYIWQYAEKHEGNYPASLQQLDVQSLIMNPELLVCPSNGIPYIYLASGETKETMKKMPFVMDRLPVSKHYHMAGENSSWSYDPVADTMTWTEGLKFISRFTNDEMAQFIRKKLIDYEKIDIDAN